MLEEGQEAIIYNEASLYEDPDLKFITSRRVIRRLIVMLAEVLTRTENNEIHVKEDRFLEVIDKMLEKEIGAFASELNRYERKNGSSLFDDLERARSGVGKAVLDLIAWDKAWLKRGWVTDYVIVAQDTADFNFIKKYGQEIAKQPGADTRPLNRDLIEMLKPFIDSHGFGDGEIKSIRGIHELLMKKGLISDELADFDYFVKYLRRHGVIL